MSPLTDEQILAITRPHKNLLPMYVLQALATLVAFPIVMPVLYFKYHTLKYRIDAQGISASWGIIFRREIYLTYKRIQDIHVSRNIFERWLGIGSVDVQTAGGSGGADLSLEGMGDYAAVRDFLYRKMRGHEHSPTPAVDAAATAASPANTADADLVALLGEIRAELASARAALERKGR